MKHWNTSDQAVRQPTRMSMADLLPPAQLDASGLCDLYGPGHQIHYKHQAEAADSPMRTVRDIYLNGTHVTLQLDDGDELAWSTHDPRRLRRILELVPGPGAAYPTFHALRVGPYWFNCATQTDSWQDCRLSRPADGA